MIEPNGFSEMKSASHKWLNYPGKNGFSSQKFFGTSCKFLGKNSYILGDCERCIQDRGKRISD